MAQPTYNIHKTTTVSLVGLLRPEEPTADWQRGEFAAILNHQLASSIEKELRAAGFDTAPLDLTTVPIHSFRNLFEHPSPPLPLLLMAKDYARRLSDSDGAQLPRDIANAIYFGVIALAWLRHGQKITSLDHAGILAGARWSLKQPWLSKVLANVFTEYLNNTNPAQPVP